MAIDFNPQFPGDISNELNNRADAIRNREVSWNYKKYAYINVRTTGNSKTILCSKSFSIGDSSATKAGHLSMYNDEGGIRKAKPVLGSVNIFCDGGSDYTDAAIWEGTINFKVFTLIDLTGVEESFFRIGAEVEIDFGWRGRGGSANKGTINGAVTNFSYSIDLDGSFSCTVNVISPGALWDSSLGDTVEADYPGDVEAEEDNNIIKALELLHKKAFGISGDDEYGGVADGGIKGIAVGPNNFLLGNIQGFKKTGGTNLILFTLGGTKDIFVPYVTLGTFVRYVNDVIKKNDSEISSIEFFSKTQNLNYRDGFASANPTEIVLPGEFANYGVDLNWSTQLKSSTLQLILISLPVLLNAYEKTKQTKGSETFPPKISALFKEIFQKIDDLTGGLVTLKLVPDIINQNQVNVGKKEKLFIVNRKTVIDTTIQSPYEFKVLELGSLLRSVSLSSDFDSDAILAATKKSKNDGSSNVRPLENLYQCGASGNTPTPFAPIAPTIGAAGPASPAAAVSKLQIAKKNIAEKGFNSEKVSSYSAAMLKYIKRNAASFGSGYQELPYNLNLSVTIDGISGMPYFAPITIDRIPSRFKGNVFFSITKVEHTFDGQGEWETKFDTVLRLK